MLDLLDELGIAEDTFVMYSTDNGPHRNTWPDGGMTPFRSEKNTNWEGAFRIPLLVRWPGKIKAGSVCNEIVQHHDWLPTFLAMAGAPDVVDKLKKGYKAIGRTYKNHIDGYNFLPYLTGQAKEGPRKFSSTSATTATCWACATTTGSSCSWSSALQGTMRVWAEPFIAAAPAQDLQPAHRPIRVRGHHVEHVLRLVPVTTPTSSTRRRPAQPSSRRRSRISRRCRGRTPSPSTTRWRRCSERRPGSAETCWHRWNDGAAKSAIVDFVARVTQEGGPDFVPPAERIATFDNDGTLWCEQPVQVQVFFLHRPGQGAGGERSVAEGTPAVQGVPRA